MNVSTTLHDIRRLALQMLYQLDARQGEDEESIRDSLLDAARDPGNQFAGPWAVPTVSDPEAHARAFRTALGAWGARAEADRIATSLAPEWPTHRQPVVDRNVIRLCWYEMTQGDVPPKAAVNEAVELAKEFGTDRSSAFLNGVLDRMLRRVLHPEPSPAGAEHTADHAAEHATQSLDAPVLHTEFWSSE